MSSTWIDTRTSGHFSTRPSMTSISITLSPVVAKVDPATMALILAHACGDTRLPSDKQRSATYNWQRGASTFGQDTRADGN